jgi:hypothetical protein
MRGTRVPDVFDHRLSFVTTAQMVKQVAQAAQSEMTSSGSWLRRAVLDRLQKEQRAEVAEGRADLIQAP